MELREHVTVNESALRNPHVAAAVGIAVEEMRSRFRCFLSQLGEGVIDSFRKFNHNAWPESQDALVDYGRAEVQVLIQHFDSILRK